MACPSLYNFHKSLALALMDSFFLANRAWHNSPLRSSDTRTQTYTYTLPATSRNQSPSFPPSKIVIVLDRIYHVTHRYWDTRYSTIFTDTTITRIRYTMVHMQHKRNTLQQTILCTVLCVRLLHILINYFCRL